MGQRPELEAVEFITPDDLLRQMHHPFQYLKESGMWEVTERVLPLSNDLVMVSPFLERRPDAGPAR